MAERRKIQMGTLNQSNPTTFGASLPAGTPASRPCTVFGEMALRYDVLVSAATVATGVTLTLQQSPGPDHTGNTPIWTNIKSVSVNSTASDEYYTITVQEDVTGDQAYLPLAEMTRLVIQTGAGDSVTINRVTSLS